MGREGQIVKRSQKLPTVFLVEEYEAYEPSPIVAAFETKDGAEKFCSRRNKPGRSTRYLVVERKVRES